MKVPVNNVLELVMSISTSGITMIECPETINKSVAFDIADNAIIGFGITTILYLPQMQFSKKIGSSDSANEDYIHLMDQDKYCELGFDEHFGYRTYVNDGVFKSFETFKKDIFDYTKEEEIGLILISDALTIIEGIGFQALFIQLKELQRKIELPIAVICEDTSGVAGFDIVTLPDHMKNDGSRGKEFVLLE